MSDFPQLEPWQFRPDLDDASPGLYLCCVNLAQREAVMRALGWRSADDVVAEQDEVLAEARRTKGE
jgi:hypothetical protein